MPSRISINSTRLMRLLTALGAVARATLRTVCANTAAASLTH